jgi:uncharacterized protein (TIGR00290 family)
MQEKTIVGWSGGKDSALALYEILKTDKYEVFELLTTLTRDYDRISIHGVRRELLDQQAKSMELPIEKMFISKNASNEEYERELLRILAKHRDKGVFSVVFGDIFLEEVRKYREQMLSRIGMKCIFPLWKRDTPELALSFINNGFKAVITNVDSSFLGKEYAGRMFNEQLLYDLPPNVDPCGENGEFHSFVFDGPIFHDRIFFKKGKTVLKENRFYYCDLMPLT